MLASKKNYTVFLYKCRKYYNFALSNAIVAQLVEHWLPKPRVAGSSPVYRSCQMLVSVYHVNAITLWK